MDVEDTVNLWHKIELTVSVAINL